MKPRVRYDHWVPQMLSWGPMVIAAITIYPYILISAPQRSKINWDDPYDQAVTVNHEMIHIAQYEELKILGFLWLYNWDYWVGRLRYGYSHEKAYMRIRFEQEAYAHQTNHYYLSTRQKKAWRRYQVFEEAKKEEGAA